MPCALTSDADYPDYLKSILKEIDSGNDDALKACACALKSPVTDEGCTILDEDGKVGAFPFCWEFTEDTSLVGDGTWNPLKLPLEEVMWLYWQSTNFSHIIGMIREGKGCGCCEPTTLTIQKKLKYERYITQKKELVCPKGISLTYDANGILYTSPPEAPCACNIQTPISYSYFPGGFFFDSYFCTYPNPGEILNIKQYYIKEGEKYYFYPSFAIFWTISYNTSVTTRNYNGDFSCEISPGSSPTVTEKTFNMQLNGKNKSLKLYQFQTPAELCPYLPTYNITDMIIS